MPPTPGSRPHVPLTDANPQGRRKSGAAFFIGGLFVLATAVPLTMQRPDSGFGFERAERAADDPGTARLEITVRQDGSGDLLGGALVQVTDGERSFLDVTGPDGLAVFTVPHGLWMVRARALRGGLASTDVAVAPGAPLPARLVVLIPRR